MNPAPSSIGLSNNILADLHRVFSQFPHIAEVWLYGSRARGDYAPGADIDLAVVAPDMSDQEFARLFSKLEALPIAFKMDVLHWDQLDNPALQHNIIKDHTVLYPNITRLALTQANNELGIQPTV